MDTSLGFMVEALPALLAGALVTLQLTAIAVILGSIGGIALGIARLSKIKLLSLAARAYIDFFRGTPLLVQLFMIYFGVPPLLRSIGLDFTFNQWSAAIVGLSLNSAAYLAEIVRGGILAVEQGQKEASECLGLSATQTMRYVIFPQALRRMIPPLGNEFITLLKDTSLVAVIGYQELFRQAQLIVATNFRSFEIYGLAALMYLALTVLSSQVFSWLERKMNPAVK
ncbi:MAG: arginine/lysine/histidine/glutamine transport system substrate-binding and permease protein [Phormidesmis priestleyi Ana]|uniref:Arginine/lysine/histidine/glutamine transport system substrate-binding and permease protein n=1 Tax=Phormidesmis priestleyi Ana TaxID=1666911 RepID=A0A0P7ZQU9_9CYAN|nr:MAG: arginine/lysine/histidine/glutamine transport system substrate-binding and permease protein [Phormidesmis priestleyi Ana]